MKNSAVTVTQVTGFSPFLLRKRSRGYLLEISVTSVTVTGEKKRRKQPMIWDIWDSAACELGRDVRLVQCPDGAWRVGVRKMGRY